MLGQILRETREAAGLTQEELALTAGVDRSYVSQLERELKSPTVSMLFRLCEALRASPSTVISRLEAATAKPKRSR